MSISQLLEELEQTQDPLLKWRLLQQTKEAASELEAARLWWLARYQFTDRKQTLVRDRFVWLLLLCKQAAGKRPGRDASLAETYREALCTPELEAAMQADDQLWQNLLEAAQLYTDTLRTPPMVLGIFAAARDKNGAETNRRVAGEIVTTLLEPLAAQCSGLPHLDLLLRAVAAGAKTAYPGILPDLLFHMEQIGDAAVRGAVAGALQDNPFGDA